MKRLALIALVLLAGCIPITHHHHEKTYCFIPEGCTIEGHHYNPGDVIR